MKRVVRHRTPRTPLSVGLRSLVVQPGPSQDRIHDLHRALRKHRLSLEGRWVGRGSVTSQFPATLRTLERSLGTLRDLTLFRATLDSVAPKAPTASERAWRESVLGRVRTQEAAARRRLSRLASRGLGSARSRAVLASRDRGRTKAGAEDEGSRAGRRRLRDALRRARRHLSPGRAHALRKELRRALLVGSPRRGAPRHRSTASLRRLVAELGRLHDLDVALERVERSPRPGRRRWNDRILRERRALARRIRRDLHAVSTGRRFREVAMHAAVR